MESTNTGNKMTLVNAITEITKDLYQVYLIQAREMNSSKPHQTLSGIVTVAINTLFSSAFSSNQNGFYFNEHAAYCGFVIQSLTTLASTCPQFAGKTIAELLCKLAVCNFLL